MTFPEAEKLLPAQIKHILTNTKKRKIKDTDVFDQR